MSTSILLQFISLRHLLREKRTWLTLVGVALGISVFVSIRIANMSVLDAYHQSVDAFSGKTTLEILAQSGTLDEIIIQKVREEASITLISPIVQTVLPLGTSDDIPSVLLMVMGLDLLGEADFRGFEVVDGEESNIDLSTAFALLLEADTALLTQDFALRQGLKVGDSFELRQKGVALPFTVSGLIKGDLSRIRDGNIAIVDIATAQWRFDKLGQLDRIDLITPHDLPLDALIERLEKRLGDAVVIRRPQQRNRQVEKMLNSFQMNLTALSAISLFVGLFLIYNTLLVSVAYRRKEIGLLRALGVSRQDIFRLFTIEGLLIGTLGGFFGVLLGAVFARWVVQALSQTVSALYVLIPPTPFSLPLQLFLEGLGIGIVVATLSSVQPAWQAAGLKPREAMEGRFTTNTLNIQHSKRLGLAALAGLLSLLLSQMPVTWGFAWKGYLAAGLLLAAFSVIVPSAIVLFCALLSRCFKYTSPSFRLAQGHLEQAIHRNAPTIAAFMAALAMMVSVVIMIESFRTTVVHWIDQSIQADIHVFPSSYMTSDSDEALPLGIREKLEAIPEIAAVDGYRSKFVLFRKESVELVGRNLDVHAQHSAYLFREGEARSILESAVRTREVLISEVLANRFGLAEGQTILIPSPEGVLPFEISGVFFDYGTDGGKMVIDRHFFQTIWQDETIDVAGLYLKDGSDLVALRQKLMQQWGAETGISFTTQSVFRDEIMAIFDQTFLITYALEWIAIVVALLGIANTLFVSILERRREIGILRAVGASRGQVLRVVLVEALYMALIGNTLALFSGFFLSLLLIFVINKASFGWTLQFHFPPEIILHSFLLAIVAALIASYFPAKKAAATDLKEAIAYE